MKKLLKKLVVVSTATILLVQMTAVPVLADGKLVRSVSNGAAAMEPFQSMKTASISLEAAIQKVKANFDVPQELKDFSSGFSSYNGRQIWSLSWSSSSDGGSFSAQVDAENGDILNINSWKNVTANEPDSVTKQDAAKIANDLVNRLLADRIDNLKFIEEEDQIVSLRDYGERRYSFRWQRLHNQLPVIGDYVAIQISSKDGRVAHYNLSWSKASLPDAGKVISQSEAIKAFTDSPMLKLKYYQPSFYRPLAIGEKRDINLVYELAYQNAGGAIDAITGQPIKFENGQWTSTSSDDALGRGSAEKQMSPTALTPEELREIEETEKLVSQEDAIAVVKRYVEFPEDMVMRHVSLNKDWQTNERIWYFEWVSEQRDENQKYLSARVNAVTNELWGFSLVDPAGENLAGTAISRDEARKIGETFLQKVQPIRFKQVQARTEDPVNIIFEGRVDATPLARPFQFGYERVVNGLPFPNNSMEVIVNPVTKQVTSFNLYWGEYNFPSTDGVLSMENAVRSYLDGRPLTLCYLKIFKDGQAEEMQLVYLPYNHTGMPETHIIDAKTGEHLNWQGKPLREDPKPLYFEDIAGDNAEEEIAQLGKAGAFGEYGSNFRPNENITLISLIRASLIAENGPWGYVDQTDAEIIKTAEQRGWLTPNAQPSQQVSRQELATLMIRMLNVERIASLEGIYTLSFEDADKISPKYVGHVAIANALKLIESDDTFEPDQAVTRSEAALAIVRTISALDNR